MDFYSIVMKFIQETKLHVNNILFPLLNKIPHAILFLLSNDSHQQFSAASSTTRLKSELREAQRRPIIALAIFLQHQARILTSTVSLFNSPLSRT